MKFILLALFATLLGNSRGQIAPTNIATGQFVREIVPQLKCSAAARLQCMQNNGFFYDCLGDLTQFNDTEDITGYGATFTKRYLCAALVDGAEVVNANQPTPAPTPSGGPTPAPTPLATTTVTYSDNTISDLYANDPTFANLTKSLACMVARGCFSADGTPGTIDTENRAFANVAQAFNQFVLERRDWGPNLDLVTGTTATDGTYRNTDLLVQAISTVPSPASSLQVAKITAIVALLASAFLV